LFFVQFLRDLGINATSNLRKKRGSSFFSTPTDDVEALDKIREALAVYLNLPSIPVCIMTVFNHAIKTTSRNLQHSQRMMEMEMRSAHTRFVYPNKNIEIRTDNRSAKSFIDNQIKIIEKLRANQ
jgi:hypothetical protein